MSNKQTKQIQEELQMKMKKYELTNVTVEGKSYAECFRQFWAFYMNEDLQKTIETIELVGIRTSDSEYFVAKNGSKKKNIRLGDTDTWIYTHLTPKAMEKVYDKFTAGWEGKYEKSDQTKMVEKTVLVPETDDDASETEIEEAQPIHTVKSEMDIRNEIAQEKYGKSYDELSPSLKGQVGRAWKKLLEENEKQLTTEELDAVEI
jgi:hypothetical protein